MTFLTAFFNVPTNTPRKITLRYSENPQVGLEERMDRIVGKILNAGYEVCSPDAHSPVPIYSDLYGKVEGERLSAGTRIGIVARDPAHVHYTSIIERRLIGAINPDNGDVEVYGRQNVGEMMDAASKLFDEYTSMEFTLTLADSRKIWDRL